MRVLGIESSSSRSGVAAVDSDGPSTESVFEHHQGLLINLAPTIQSLVSAEGAPSVDGIAVSLGPGSFTGLRIGVATAKALAYAWNVPIVGVPTMEALLRTVELECRDVSGLRPFGEERSDDITAFVPSTRPRVEGNQVSVAADPTSGKEQVQIRDTYPSTRGRVEGTRQIGLMIRSRRGEVFGAICEHGDDGGRVLSDVVCVTVDEFLEMLAGLGASRIVIAGDAAVLYKESIAQAIPGAVFVSEEANFASPLHVARIGMERLLRGESDDPVALAPRYYRRTYVGTE